jgi:hypothetical protein
LSDECGRVGKCDGEEQCFKHRIQSVNIAPSAMPSRHNRKPPQQSRYNKWENGVATDHRGVPLLDEKGALIGLKKLANNRHKVESQLRDLHNSAQPKD